MSNEQVTTAAVRTNPYNSMVSDITSYRGKVREALRKAVAAQNGNLDLNNDTLRDAIEESITGTLVKKAQMLLNADSKSLIYKKYNLKKNSKILKELAEVIGANPDKPEIANADEKIKKIFKSYPETQSLATTMGFDQFKKNTEADLQAKIAEFEAQEATMSEEEKIATKQGIKNVQDALASTNVYIHEVIKNEKNVRIAVAGRLKEVAVENVPLFHNGKALEKEEKAKYLRPILEKLTFPTEITQLLTNVDPKFASETLSGIIQQKISEFFGPDTPDMTLHKKIQMLSVDLNKLEDPERIKKFTNTINNDMQDFVRDKLAAKIVYDSISKKATEEQKLENIQKFTTAVKEAEISITILANPEFKALLTDKKGKIDFQNLDSKKLQAIAKEVETKHMAKSVVKDALKPALEVGKNNEVSNLLSPDEVFIPHSSKLPQVPPALVSALWSYTSKRGHNAVDEAELRNIIDKTDKKAVMELSGDSLKKYFEQRGDLVSYTIPGTKEQAVISAPISEEVMRQRDVIGNSINSILLAHDETNVKIPSLNEKGSLTTQEMKAVKAREAEFDKHSKKLAQEQERKLATLESGLESAQNTLEKAKQSYKNAWILANAFDQTLQKNYHERADHTKDKEKSKSLEKQKETTGAVLVKAIEDVVKAEVDIEKMKHGLGNYKEEQRAVGMRNKIFQEIQSMQQINDLPAEEKSKKKSNGKNLLKTAGKILGKVKDALITNKSGGYQLQTNTTPTKQTNPKDRGGV